MKNHPSVAKFTSAEEMAKGYVNLEKKIGMKGVILPGENATPEEMTEFHKEMGCIMEADKCEIDVLPEGMDERIIQDDTTKKAFQDIAVKAHLTPEQAKELQSWWLETQVNRLKALDKTMEDEMNASATALRKEWGAKYDENVSKVNIRIKNFGGKEALKWFSKGEGNNPMIIKLFSSIAEKMGEDVKGPGGSSNLTLTPGEAKVKIDEIRDNPKSAYNDGNHRNHAEAVKYMGSLYEMANAK